MRDRLLGLGQAARDHLAHVVEWNLVIGGGGWLGDGLCARCRGRRRSSRCLGRWCCTSRQGRVDVGLDDPAVWAAAVQRRQIEARLRRHATGERAGGDTGARRCGLRGRGGLLVAPTWDTGESWVATMRHIAKEAGCWVIGTATALQGNDIPADFPDRDKLFTPDEWINDGGAVVVKPMGAIAAGPMNREKGILYAEIDREAARRARRSLDICGHYSRPDVFSFSVDRRALTPVTFSD